MKYSSIFGYANQFLQNKICVYLHSDMCIESGFDKLNNENTDNKIYALTSHNSKCNNKFICNCTRQKYTDRGYYGVTFDGFVFRSPLKEEVINDTNHIVHMLGSESRTICILKENGYDVVCPNQVLKCIHHHNVKIFAHQHSYWINREGEIKPQEYYSSIHRMQRNLPWDKKIVGGGIPFFMGSCKFVNVI